MQSKLSLSKFFSDFPDALVIKSGDVVNILNTNIHVLPCPLLQVLWTRIHQCFRSMTSILHPQHSQIILPFLGSASPSSQLQLLCQPTTIPYQYFLNKHMPYISLIPLHFYSMLNLTGSRGGEFF